MTQQLHTKYITTFKFFSCKVIESKKNQSNEPFLRFRNFAILYEGREFAIFFRSLEQFIQTVRGQNNFW